MSVSELASFQASLSKRDGAWKKILKDPIAVVSGLIAFIIIFLVAFADFFAPQSPTKTDLKSRLQPPSFAHPMGTDGAGRDEWSRLLHGGQLTLLGALIVLVVAITLGVVSGLLAGYYGKWMDTIGSWVVALLMTLPLMIVLLAVRASFGTNLIAIMGTLGILILPGFYLLVRSSVRAVRNELYVDAAKVSGLSDSRIIGRHILLAIRAPLIILAMMIASMSIGIQSALDFLGLGSTAGPTWGGMLSEAFEKVYEAPQLMFWPALMIGLMTSSLLMLGNSIRDAVEDRPRLKLSKEMRAAAHTNAGAPPIELESDQILAVRDLSISYQTPQGHPREVVHTVSLTIRLGKVLGLVGESGSGKTQIAFSVLGLLPEIAAIESGSISFQGRNLLSLNEHERQQARVGGFAYIPQEPMANLDPSFTIGDQLTEPLRFARGMSKHAAHQEAVKLLEQVSINDPEAVMKKYPHEISGGMAQRVLIAGALGLEPILLVADEPTTALDVTVQAEVLALLRKLQQERNLSIMLVTHDLGVAAEMCDDIVVLKDGSVVEAGSVEDIFYRPQDEYTKSLLGATFANASPRLPKNFTREGEKS